MFSHSQTFRQLIDIKSYEVGKTYQGSNSRFALHNLQCEFEFLQQKQLPGTQKCEAKLPL